MPRIARIVLYPIKSLPGIEVNRAELTLSGALRLDRSFAMVDESGTRINGKNEPRVHRLAVRFALHGEALDVTLPQAPGSPTYRLGAGAARADMDGLANSLSGQLERRVRLVHDSMHGFPDDTDSPGPTIVSEASLNELAAWYPGRSLDEMRARFRANLEVSDCPSFWEDGLFGPPGIVRRIRIGQSELIGVNPCKRCVVPTRNPWTGDVLENFQRNFVRRRRETLPAWADPARFEFFYRFAVNTRAVPGHAGGVIRVGDPIAVA